MAKKRYHDAMIKETDGDSHLPTEVIVKKYPSQGRMNGDVTDLYNCVEDHMNKDNAKIGSLTDVKKF